MGFTPTSPVIDDGQTMEPSVSVPTPATARLAEIAVPVPELEPQALRSSAYGLRTSPPRALQPLADFVDRKFAHSLRFVLPRMTAPAARSRSTRNASRSGAGPTSASEPAVVIIRSAVSMLSFSRMGMPWSAPRGPFSRRSRSSASAIVQRVRTGLDDAPERRAAPVDGLDPRQVALGNLTRRVAAGGHPRLQLIDRGLFQLERDGLWDKQSGAKNERDQTGTHALC